MTAVGKNLRLKILMAVLRRAFEQAVVLVSHFFLGAFFAPIALGFGACYKKYWQ